MRRTNLAGVVMVVAMLGCEGAPILGGTPKPPPDGGYDDDADAESKQSALVLSSLYQTVPGHNKAESSNIYSCSGWSYRMLMGWEQHRDPASPTGWYAAIGPSSASTTGTVSDVSADVYLQCPGGILPVDHGVSDTGYAWNTRLWAGPALHNWCTLYTVWPASWGLPNPHVQVYVEAYDYVPMGITGNGTLYLALSSSVAPGIAGNGWCGGSSWYQVNITTTEKFNGYVPVQVAPNTSCPPGSSYNAADMLCYPVPPCWGLSAPDYKNCITPPPPPV